MATPHEGYDKEYQKMLTPCESQHYDPKLSTQVSQKLSALFKKRRTIRQFADTEIPDEVIFNAVDVARFAPSGANRQPWSFAVIKKSELKKEVRRLSEKEEELFYEHNPNQKWLEDLKHLHTDKEKEFLEQSPYLIVVFYSHYSLDEKGEKKTHYYAKESVGIATGMLISTLHLSGISTLTYTPKRMQFLSKLLGRPEEERPFMVLACGIRHQDARVPLISKKALSQIMSFYP